MEDFDVDVVNRSGTVTTTLSVGVYESGEVWLRMSAGGYVMRAASVMDADTAKKVRDALTAAIAHAEGRNAA